MKCDRCDRPATIEEVTKVGSSYVYKHLCEACAAREGLAGVPPLATVTVTHAIEGASAVLNEVPAGPGACAGCGLTFAQFRSTGRVGCPSCYEAFEPRLGPMIERAQDGGTHHVGKVPRRVAESAGGSDRAEALARLLGSAREREIKLEQLRRQLESALAGERFEQAAMIRDEIRRLREAGAGRAGGVGDGPG